MDSALSRQQAHIIERLYAGVHDRNAVDEACAAIGEMIGAVGVNLRVADATASSTLFLAKSGWAVGDETWRAYIEDGFAAIDPTLELGRRLIERRFEGVIVCQEHIPDHVRDRHPWYQEFAAPRGFLWTTGAAAQLPGEQLMLMGGLGAADAEPFHEDAKAALEPVLPHMKRVLALMAKLSEMEARFGALEQGLQHANTGLALIDVAGHIRWTNASAQAILARGGALREVNRRLRATGPKVHALITEMVADAIARRTQRLAPETIVVHDGEGEHLRIQTLPSGPLRQGLPGGALVSMRPILRRLRADVGESLSCLYGLTPAQARVAIAIAEGQTLNQYAAANGLTRETPKGQLAEVFNKTGVSRQAELVSLIWRISG